MTNTMIFSDMGADVRYRDCAPAFAYEFGDFQERL
jgi:hypothetical protein